MLLHCVGSIVTTNDNDDHASKDCAMSRGSKLLTLTSRSSRCFFGARAPEVDFPVGHDTDY